MNTENKKVSLIIGTIMTAFITILTLWGLSNHEVWFDETQAWVIAKNCSWREILISIPPYEGHPPLWHIFLKFASYIGLPFTASLKLVQFISFEAALILLEFKSPFNSIMKIVLPLGYYFSFQYAIVSRPYALLMTAVFLSALCYKKRMKKPFVYMLSLLFMCLCHSYGIALAGGLIIADIAADITAERSLFKAYSALIKNKKRLASYIILLVAAICLAIEIFPAKDTFAVDRTNANTLTYLKNLFWAWFFIPAENLFTSNLVEYELIQDQSFELITLVRAAAFSIIIWIFIFVIAHKRKTVLAVFVPYFLLSFLYARYASPHHFGVFYIFLIFILWICADEKPLCISDFKLFEIKENYWKLIKKSILAFLCIPVVINISWNIHSFNTDKKYPYDAAKELFSWIEENGYRDGYTWFAGYKEDDTNFNSGTAVILNAYYGENIFYNMHDNKPYITHIKADKTEFETDIAEMKRHGSPDFIVAYDRTINENCEAIGIDGEYEIVFHRSGNRVFKNLDTESVISVYAKKGLVKHKSNEFGF